MTSKPPEQCNEPSADPKKELPPNARILSSSQVTQDPPNTKPLQLAARDVQHLETSIRLVRPEPRSGYQHQAVGPQQHIPAGYARCIRQEGKKEMGQKRLVLYCDIIVSSLSGRQTRDRCIEVSLRLQQSASAARHSFSATSVVRDQSTQRLLIVQMCKEERGDSTSFIGKGKVESCMALPKVCAEPLPASNILVSSSSHAIAGSIVKCIQFFKLEVRRFVKFLLWFFVHILQLSV